MCTLRDHRYHFLNHYVPVFLYLKFALIIANSVDPDEMQHFATFHLGLHCFPKYPFISFQYTNLWASSESHLYSGRIIIVFCVALYICHILFK